MPLLADWHAQVRRTAVRTLAAIGWPAALAVPALAQLLPDRDEEVREAAVEGLARLGTPAVGPLLDLCTAPDPPRLRERVGEMIADAAWGPGCERLRDGAWCFRQSVADDHCPAAVREGGAKALGRMGPDAADAVPALLRMLTDPAAPSRPRRRPVCSARSARRPGRPSAPSSSCWRTAPPGCGRRPPRHCHASTRNGRRRRRRGRPWARSSNGSRGATTAPQPVLDAFVLAGPAVVPHLIAALSAPDRNQRESAAVALGASARQPPPPSPRSWPP